MPPRLSSFNNYGKEIQMSSVATVLREGARGLGIDIQSIRKNKIEFHLVLSEGNGGK